MDDDESMNKHNALTMQCTNQMETQNDFYFIYGENDFG
jgi:hypothetical protein